MVGLKFGVLGSISWSYLLGATLSTLWGMIHSLQIVGHFSLLPIAFTARAQNFLTLIHQIITFDFVDVGD